MKPLSPRTYRTGDPELNAYYRRCRRAGLRPERPTLYRIPRKRGEDLSDAFGEFHEARTEDEHDRLSQRRLRAERNE